MKENTVKNCVMDLKKLRALPPYNNYSNIVAGDGRFAKYIDRTYSKRVRLLAEKELKHNNRLHLTGQNDAPGK